MNFFEGMAEGAANQATGILNAQMRDDAQLDKQQALAKFNADLEEKKTRTRLALEQEFRDAPLNRLGTKAKELAGQEVPVEAEQVAPVTTTGGILSRDGMVGVDGKPIQKTGESRGLATGLPGGAQSIAEMKDQILNDPNVSEEDKRGLVAQLDAQAAQENQANAARATAAVAGKTRKRTADEALLAAVDDAKINDLPAAAAYEANIGKPKRDERRADNLERKSDLQEKKNDAEAADRKRRADWLQTHQTEALELQREIARTNAQRGGADAKDPAAVSTAKWLAANKDDPVMMDAWERANQTKSKDVKGIAADLMAKDPMLSAAEAVTKARELVEASDAPKNGADKPITQAEYAKLPSGAVFTAPDGSKRRKP